MGPVGRAEGALVVVSILALVFGAAAFGGETKAGNNSVSALLSAGVEPGKHLGTSVLYSTTSLSIISRLAESDVESLSIYKIVGGTRALQYTLVGGVGFKSLEARLIEPGRYFVGHGPGDLSEIVVDEAAPKSALSSVRCKSGALATATGTATDDVAGVSKVRVAVGRNPDHQWWDGTGWSKEMRWIDARGTDRWEVDLPRERSLDVLVSAVDGAGNEESPHRAPLSVEGCR